MCLNKCGAISQKIEDMYFLNLRNLLFSWGNKTGKESQVVPNECKC